MKNTVIAILIAWALLSVVAWKIQPAPDDPNKNNLIWLSDDNPTRQGQLELFNKLHSNYCVRLDPANADAGGSTEKVIVQSLAGVGPDMFDSYGAYRLSLYAKSGVAWDITDELKKSGIDIRKDTWKLALESMIYNGRVYGVPSNAGAPVIWYNKDIFDKCHVPYPKNVRTWKEFLPILQRLTIRDKNGRVKQYGLLFDAWMIPQFILQWGGSKYTPDGTRCVIDSPEAIAGVQFFHDLMYKYHVMPSPADAANMASQGGWGSETMTLFSGGKGATANGGRYWLCSLRNMKNMRLGAIECPYERRKIYLGSSRITMINKKSPHRKQALEFLKYLISRDYNELINHQADCVAPIKKYCYTQKYLHDPDYPDEDYNAIMRDVINYSRDSEVSPFVNTQVADSIINKQLDLVRSNKKPVAEAMRTAAREVNAEIAKTIENDPKLRAQYMKLTGGKTR